MFKKSSSNIIKFISIIFLFTYCSSQNSIKIDRYKEFKKFYLPQIFSSFPINESNIDSSLTQTIVYPASIYTTGYSGVFMDYQYSFDEYNKIIKKFQAIKKFSANVMDSCNNYIPKIKNNKMCHLENLPVPNINDEFSELLKIVNKKNSEFIVFDSKSGIFIKNKYANYINRSKKNSNNGFSTGVILNNDSNSIIYWLIVW